MKLNKTKLGYFDALNQVFKTLPVPLTLRENGMLIIKFVELFDIGSFGERAEKLLSIKV